MAALPADQTCAYLIEPGLVELRRVPIPAPTAGQVLLRIEAALAGGTDRKAFVRGHPQIPMPGPFGHRYSGTVAALGAGIPNLEPGQPVMGVHSAPCLACSYCRHGRWNLCPDVMKEKVLGAFAQYLLVPAPIVRQNLFHRPKNLTAAHAAFLEPLACVVHGLELLDWRCVNRVLILGLGAMGLLFAQLLPHYTTASRAGVGRRSPRPELARRFGLDPVWDVETRPFAQQLDPADCFDCVIECTGRLEGWQEAFERTTPGGQTLLFGGLPRGVGFPVDSYRLHYEEIRLLGSFHFSPRDVARARDYLLGGTLDLDPLITARLPSGALADGLRRLDRGEAIQFLIDPFA
jgi:L-iditol 2-dehydrogenase